MLRGAFLGGGIENTRFDGEALRESPRVSEEQWFIVVHSDGTKHLLKNLQQNVS